MTYTVVTSKKAERDMQNIADYISDELHDVEAAFKLMLEIRMQIRQLNQMPKRYPLVSDKRLAKRGIRSFPVKNYIVFYSIDDDTKIVNITSVMYGRRNWVNLL